MPWGSGRDVGKMYGVRFDLWLMSGRLEPQMVLFEKKEPPTKDEIAT